jgi:hypothetical protein
MEHSFALDRGEAHLMFLATRETVLAAGGGIGGRLATWSAPVGLPSYRSGVRADARFGLALLACPHSAPEQSVLRGAW